LGTLRRAVTTPHGATAIVAGKWLAGGAALALVSAVGLAAGRWLFGIELANPVLAFLWLALVGLGLLALFTVIQLLPRSERAANVLVNAITLPMAMLGGSFFPFEAMPDWMVAVGTSTPNGWALVRLRAILDGAAEPQVLAASAGVVAAVVVVLGALVARRLRGWAA
jgi:ABC-2 type transport system permease protein